MIEDSESVTGGRSKSPISSNNRRRGRTESLISPARRRNKGKEPMEYSRSPIRRRNKGKQPMEYSRSPIRRRDKGKEPIEYSRSPIRGRYRGWERARESRSPSPENFEEDLSHWNFVRDLSRSPQRRFGDYDKRARSMRRKGGFGGHYRPPLTRRQREKEYGLHIGVLPLMLSEEASLKCTLFCHC